MWFDQGSMGNCLGEWAYFIYEAGPQGHTVLAASLYENLSWLGLMEKIPQNPAGIRTEPPVFTPLVQVAPTRSGPILIEITLRTDISANTY